MTALGVITMSMMPTEDIAGRKNPYSAIELKVDIEQAAKKLGIKKPYSLSEASAIADYMNKMEELVL